MCRILWILNCVCRGKKWSWSSVRCPPLLQGATAACIPGRSHYRDFKTTLDTPYTVVSSGRVIGPTQRPLHDNTQHLQETDIRAPGGIRNRNSRIRAAADTRLRKRGHWIDSSGLNPTSVWRNLRRTTKSHRIAGWGPRFELWISQVWSKNFTHFTAKFA